jgi:hypothetical protein
MNSNESKRRTERMLRSAPIFLALSVAGLLNSVLSGQHSLVYICGAVMIGLPFTALSITCWRVESNPLQFLALFIVSILLVTQGEHFIRDWAFPDMQMINGSWLLMLQYLSVIMATFFGILCAFRPLIRRLLDLQA